MTKTKGLDDLMANLNREFSGIKTRGVAGLLEGGLLVERRSQRKGARRVRPKGRERSGGLDFTASVPVLVAPL
jgi:hypothetical protein